MDPKLLGLIDTAIQREEDAYGFYMKIHDKVSDPSVRETIEWIAGEEKKHKAFLVKYRNGDFGTGGLRLSDVVYYKIAEYQEEPQLAEEMSSAQVYLVAAHRELRSNQFYRALASEHSPGKRARCCSKWPMRSSSTRRKWSIFTPIRPFPRLRADELRAGALLPEGAPPSHFAGSTGTTVTGTGEPFNTFSVTLPKRKLPFAPWLAITTRSTFSLSISLRISWAGSPTATCLM